MFKNIDMKEIQDLFSITQRLVWDHSEGILNVTAIESNDPSWIRSRLSHRQVIKWTKAKVHVYSDSVLCLGTLSEPLEANQRWKGHLTDLQPTASCQELFGIDGEPIEFEWNILPGRTSLKILQQIQSDLQGWNTEPENFGDRIIFMSMFNDIDWTRKGNEEKCISNSEEIKKYAKRISQ